MRRFKKIDNCACGDCDCHYRVTGRWWAACIFKDHSTEGQYLWHVGATGGLVHFNGSEPYLEQAKKAAYKALRHMTGNEKVPPKPVSQKTLANRKRKAREEKKAQEWAAFRSHQDLMYRAERQKWVGPNGGIR